MAKVITTELQHSGASGANVTLDSSKNVTCENNLTVDGTTTLTGAVTGTPLSFRNLIMNGEFIVDQRMGGSATAITPSAGVDYTCDRWHESNNYGEAGRITFQTVSDDVPNGNYRKAMKLDCTTAMGTPSGNNWMGFCQFIEAQDVRVLGHGTSAAKCEEVHTNHCRPMEDARNKCKPIPKVRKCMPTDAKCKQANANR